MRDIIQEINTIMDIIDGRTSYPLPKREPDINHVSMWKV